MAEDIIEQVLEPTVEPAGDTPAAAENTDTPEQTTETAPEQPEQSIPYARFKEVNERAKQAEARLAEFEKARKDAEIQAKKEAGEWKELYTDLETKLAEQRIANEQLRLSALRKDVAQKHGYAWLAERLQGDTEEEIEADLQSIVAQIPAPQAPALNGAAGSGARSAGAGNNLYTDAELDQMSAVYGIPKRFLDKEKFVIE